MSKMHSYREPMVQYREFSWVLWWPGWTGWMRGRLKREGWMYTYSGFTSLYSRNKPNIVKQLYSNTLKHSAVSRKKRNETCADKKTQPKPLFTLMVIWIARCTNSFFIFPWLVLLAICHPVDHLVVTSYSQLNLGILPAIKKQCRCPSSS